MNRWRQNKLVAAAITGVLAAGGLIGQAEINTPLVDCTSRNLRIISEVKSDPGIMSILAAQHDGLDGACGAAIQIARTVRAVSRS